MGKPAEPTVEPGVPVVEPGVELLPGYRVVSLLRRGHRLDVYDAWSATRASRCVVKVVLPDRRHEHHVGAELVREGELLGQLDHPHWARVYEVIEEPLQAVVLETMGGTTLAAMLDDERRLRPADAVLLGIQVGSALRYLHHRGWLHLDLTPSNIVVEAGRARVLDLSLAGRPGVVGKGTGTNGYRAPETRATGSVSTATDVWALGTVLLECLTGEEQDDPVGPELQAGWPRRRWPRGQVPERLRNLVDAMRSPDPARRPDLDAVLADLQHIGAPAARRRRSTRRIRERDTQRSST